MDVKGLNGIASPLANRSPPRIYNGNASSPKAPLVAGAYGQAMHSRRCRNEYVWMTEGNALLPPRLHHAPPLENHFLINGKDPAGEPRPEFPVQPMVQLLPKPHILLKLDAVTNYWCPLNIRSKLHLAHRTLDGLASELQPIKGRSRQKSMQGGRTAWSTEPLKLVSRDHNDRIATIHGDLLRLSRCGEAHDLA